MFCAVVVILLVFYGITTVKNRFCSCLCFAVINYRIKWNTGIILRHKLKESMWQITVNLMSNNNREFERCGRNYRTIRWHKISELTGFFVLFVYSVHSFLETSVRSGPFGVTKSTFPRTHMEGFSSVLMKWEKPAAECAICPALSCWGSTSSCLWCWG